VEQNKMTTQFPLLTRYVVTDTWSRGYQINIKITNNTNNPTKTWSASFLIPTGTHISSFWNANYTATGSAITVSNPSWIGGGVIKAYSYIIIGMIIQRDILLTPDEIYNLQAVANFTQVIAAPILNTINATLNNYTVSWNSVSYATKYTLQQDSTNTFANPQTITSSNVLSYSFTNVPAGTYYYRVNASNSGGTSAFSNSVSVTVVPLPLAAPFLSPINNPSMLPQYTVQWSAVTGATNYTLFQDTTNTFINPQTMYTGSSQSYSFTNMLSGTYYYRVNAFNAGVTSGYSNSVSVTVLPLSLDTPILSPIDNPSMLPQYTIKWSVVPNAVGYTLIQSTTSTFTTSQTLYSGPFVSYTVVGQPAGIYYYYVIAYAQNITSHQSNIVSVSVKQIKAITESYWESWNTKDSIASIVAMKVDIINVSFVTFITAGTNIFQVGGLDCSQTTLTQFITAGHAAGKKVKIAVGGASYPLQPQLTSLNAAMGMATAISTFVIEDNTPANLQVALIQNTRQLLGSNYLISYTAGTPASTTAPFTQVITSGNTYCDTINLMAYDAYSGYSYQQDITKLISLNVPASKIVVGLMPGFDDIGIMTNTADINTACDYVIANNLAGAMYWDMNRDLENLTGLGSQSCANIMYSKFHV
jgi:hypothetical protein